MIDMSDVIRDPDLGFVGFNIIRTCYRRRKGNIVEERTVIPADGNIQPGTPEMLQLVSEEERRDVFITIYTCYPLHTGENNTGGRVFYGADRIEYKGKQWRVVKSRDWQEFGYTQALAVLVEEDADE